MNDDDIIGVLSNDELNRVEGLYQNGLNGFAKDNGFELQPGDIVDYLKLNDGDFLVYIERNARFDWTKKEGGFKDLYDKQEKRRKLYWSDGKKMFNPMSNKAKAARELRNNPYYWAHKHGEMHDEQSGWNNPERRKQAMDYVRQGKDAWGFDAIDHYKN